MTLEAYDFPVVLKPVYTPEQVLVPSVQAVVRSDTMQAIGAVGRRYTLVEHRTVVEAAERFMNGLGKHEKRYTLAKNGATLIAEFTFTDDTVPIALGDKVGLRIYLKNTYDGSASVQIQVGALVLSCLNGMVVPKSIYNFSYRHVGRQEILLPQPEDLLYTYRQQAAKWKSYGDVGLGRGRGLDLIWSSEAFLPAGSRGTLEERWVEGCRKGEQSLWHLLQSVTYHITHETPKLSYLGRLNRLEQALKHFKPLENS